MTTETGRLVGLNGNIAVKAPCKAATTANITLSGEQTIDGISIVAGDRVLVKDQTNQTENGVYEASATAWSRAKDFNGARDVMPGTAVLVIQGTASALKIFAISNTSDITIGTSSISFVIIGSTEGALVDLSSAQTITGAKQFDDLTAPNFIDDMTAETSLTAGDTLAVYDDSASGQRKVTYENFFGNVGGLTELVAGSVTLNDVVAAEDVSADAGRSIKISSILAAPNLLTEETDVDADADFILLYDTSESDARKVKPESLWKSFTSSAQTITTTPEQKTVAHGLGVVIPAHQMSLRFKCTDAGGDQGWSQNDEVQLSASEWSANTGQLLRSDSTNCYLQVLSGGFIGIHKTNGTSVVFDKDKWEVYIEAVAL